jgi:hypothetical protein
VVGDGAVDSDAQAKALRLRLYVSCSECARLIDLAEGSRPARPVEGADLLSLKSTKLGLGCSASPSREMETRRGENGKGPARLGALAVEPLIGTPNARRAELRSTI